MTAPYGPYTTREQAVADAQPLRTAIDAADPGGPMSDEIRARRRAAIVTHIDNQLHAASVEIGAHDADIIDWLSTWELETIQVILGWAGQARAARDAELQGEIDTLRAQIESLETAVRRAAPIELDPTALREITERRSN